MIQKRAKSAALDLGAVHVSMGVSARMSCTLNAQHGGAAALK